MISLVTLEEAKVQLKVDGVLDDAKVAQTILAASAIVLNHIKITVPEQDSPDTRIEQMFDRSPRQYDSVPEEVKAAVLLVIGDLFENRESQTANPLSATVEALLCAWRDPTLA
jgi:hypothetical protein